MRKEERERWQSERGRKRNRQTERHNDRQQHREEELERIPVCTTDLGVDVISLIQQEIKLFSLTNQRTAKHFGSDNFLLSPEQKYIFIKTCEKLYSKNAAK